MRNSPVELVDPLGLTATTFCITDTTFLGYFNDTPYYETTQTCYPGISSGVNSGTVTDVAGTSGTANNGTALTTCQTKVLAAVNNQFGTNLTGANVLPTSDPLPAAGGEINVNFAVTGGLSPEQFNAIQPGRYAPSGIFGFLTGFGPSLHVTSGPSGLDPTAQAFGNSNVGGMLSASFTAHIDSAWANNPIGAILHWFIDVLGKNTRNNCP